ncbi:MAG TPA: hypothetical protein VGZ90_04410 [Puia sp.]|jgi:hypothetical protein|nr:hypothetical protein [Puia sp.]
MTRILLSLLIIFSFYSANAQFNKGDVLIGGTLLYSSNKTTTPYNPSDQKNNYGDINISLGKAIKENTLFGIFINYQPSTNITNYVFGPITIRTDNYGIGVFYRMYKSLGKEFYLFGEAGGGFNGSTTSTKDSTGNKISTGTGYGGSIYISPGIAYKISKKFFLELSVPQIFSLAYTSSNTKSGSVTTGKNDSFVVNANLSSNPLNSIGIGFRLVL